MFRYATKYCHSLKLHLKKYAHKPAMVLNNDGTPNPLPVIDVFGNKRGPKNSKNGSEPPAPTSGLFPSLPANFPANLPNLPNFPPNFPFFGLSQLHQLQQLNGGGAPKIAQVPPFRLEDPDKDKDERGVSPPTMDDPEKLFKCDKCEFSTSSSEVHKNHMLLHASSERGALHRLLTSPLQTAKTGTPEDITFSPSRKRTASPGSSPRSPFQQRSLFQERSESPVSSNGSPMAEYFNKIAMNNPLLQGLVPNPAIKALMEQRKRENSLGSSPDSFRNDSPSSREDTAPLPPNKRVKTDIFASLYNKMSEQAEKAESPSGVLDLSKECGTDNIIGGGSHGSSSDNETGSNPRSHSSSPSLTSSTTKNRRKGKAYKIERRYDDNSTNSEEEVSDMPSLMPIPRPDTLSDLKTCKFCGISFKNSTMYAIHMGYHGSDPFKCNLCGDQCEDALSFFLHIARKEHC